MEHFKNVPEAPMSKKEAHLTVLVILNFPGPNLIFYSHSLGCTQTLKL